MQASDGETLQHEGLTELLLEGRPRLENEERCKEEGRHILIQL